MYTGNYQALLEPNNSDIVNFENKGDFIMALGALFASETYHLPKLHELAKIEIKTHGNLLGISSRLQFIDHEIVASKNIGNCVDSTSESRKWLNEYLKAELKATYLQDEENFDGSSILDNIYNTDLVKSSAKFIFAMYNDRIQKLKNAEKKLYVKQLKSSCVNSGLCLEDEKNDKQLLELNSNRASQFGYAEIESDKQINSTQSYPFCGSFCDSSQEKAEKQVKHAPHSLGKESSPDSTQYTEKTGQRSHNSSYSRTSSIHYRDNEEREDKPLEISFNRTNFFGYGSDQDSTDNEIHTIDSYSSHTSTFVFNSVPPSEDANLDETVI